MPRLRSVLRSGQGPAAPCPHPTRLETCSGSLTFLLSAPAIRRNDPQVSTRIPAPDARHIIECIQVLRIRPYECHLPSRRSRVPDCCGKSASSVPLPWSFPTDRKSTRLNSSHLGISYAVFCLKKKNKHRLTK